MGESFYGADRRRFFVRKTFYLRGVYFLRKLTSARGWGRDVGKFSKTCQEAFKTKPQNEYTPFWRYDATYPKTGDTVMNNTHSPLPHGMAISDDERAFFIALGGRIAQQRKAQGITQVELATTLGVSQQAMNSFEKGRRRVPVSLLPVIAQTLQTTLDALVAHEVTTPPSKEPKKRGPQKKIRQQLEQIEALPLAKQRVITQLIDSAIAQAAR